MRKINNYKQYIIILLVLFGNALVMRAGIYYNMLGEKYLIIVAIVLLSLSIFVYLETEKRIGEVPYWFLNFSVAITSGMQLLGAVSTYLF